MKIQSLTARVVTIYPEKTDGIPRTCIRATLTDNDHCFPILLFDESNRKARTLNEGDVIFCSPKPWGKTDEVRYKISDFCVVNAETDLGLLVHETGIVGCTDVHFKAGKGRQLISFKSAHQKRKAYLNVAQNCMLLESLEVGDEIEVCGYVDPTRMDRLVFTKPVKVSNKTKNITLDDKSVVAKDSWNKAELPLITKDQIQFRLQELAQIISENHHEVTLLVTLTGGIFTAVDLSSYLTIPVKFEFVKASSYGHEQQSGIIELKWLSAQKGTDLGNVIIIDDIFDTGKTMDYIIKYIKSNYTYSNIETFALLNKPSRRQVPFDITYTGFFIEDKFVYGYGLDLKDYERNIQDIMYVE